MKITIISDTHNQHGELGVLSGDVLIHCGDMFDLFNKDESDFQRMDDWFGQQRFDLILCTGGNHDFPLEKRLRQNPRPFANAVYLQDRRYVHNGIVFYGAPWIPDLSGHAFYLDSAGLSDKWALIPEDVDVLITHTPPAGVLDVSSRGLALGCQHLAIALARVAPKIHCFGHVHASAGVLKTQSTEYINASIVNSQIKVARPAVETVL